MDNVAFVVLFLYIGCQIAAVALALGLSEAKNRRNPWMLTAGASALIVLSSTLILVNLVRGASPAPLDALAAIGLLSSFLYLLGLLHFRRRLSFGARRLSRAEESLRKSEEEYRRIVETAQEGVIGFDAQWSVVFVNQRACDILGYADGELAGKSLDDFIPDTERFLIQDIKEAREHGIGGTFELCLRTKSGAHIWVQASDSPVTTGGEFVGFYSLITDITARKLAEYAVERSEAKFRAVVENSNDEIVFTDAEARIVYRSPSATRISGFTDQERMWQVGFESVHPEDLGPFQEMWRQLLETPGATKRGTYRLVHADGTWHWVELNAQNLLDNPNVQSIVVTNRDVTELKKAEELLRRSEKKYRQVLDTALEGIMGFDRNWCVEFANRRAAQILGYMPDNLPGKSVFDFVPEAQRPVLDDELRKREGTGNICEAPFRTADGKLVWLRVSTSPIIESDQYAGSYSFITDITKRVQMEKALRASEEKYRQIVETAQEGIIGFDAGWRVTFINQRMHSILGYGESEVIGKPLDDFIPDDQRPKIQAIKEAREHGIGGTYELCLRTKSGTVVWLLASGSPIMEDGRFAGTYTLVTDITDRKQAEETMRRRTEQLETLARVSAAMRTAQTQDEIAQAVLSLVASLVGATAGALTTMEEDGVHATVRQGWGQWAARIGQHYAVSEGMPGTPSYVMPSRAADDCTPDAISEWSDSNAVPPCGVCVPLVTNHSSVGFLYLGLPQALPGEDLELLHSIMSMAANALQRQALHENLQARLEELQQAQQHIIQSEKLAAIGQLISGIAHELNNPLTSIVLYAQMMQRRLSDAATKRDLEMTVKESLRASKIVRGLLDFARQRPPEMQPINLNDVLRSATELASYELRTHGVELSLDLSPDIPVTLADAHQLQQVFVNLLNNAWQAISSEKQNGHVWICSELISPTRTTDTRASDRKIRITIRDDGPGILPEELPRVFDPFFTTKPEGAGTGLGLSICHGIISKHGGSIQVDSEVQAGSTFVIELPVAPSDTTLTAGNAPTPDIPKLAGHGRIMIIDDEPAVLEVLTRALQGQGYIVDSFQDAGEALQKVMELEYAAILCDIRMPGVNGAQFHWEITKNRPELAKRIVFITGDTISLRTRAFIEREDVICLTKPFELDELYEVVQRITKYPAGIRTS